MALRVAKFLSWVAVTHPLAVGVYVAGLTVLVWLLVERQFLAALIPAFGLLVALRLQWTLWRNDLKR